MTGIAVITGASAGIGRATAVAFAKRGWKVALLARGEAGLEGARRDVLAAGGEALAIPTDVAKYQEVEAAADRVEREWGPIDVWVNNAMATIFCGFLDMTPEEFERSTAVTYLGAVWGTRAALTRMKPRDRGVIVQVGSALAYRSIPLQSPYCGAKSALRGFTDSLRCELLHDKSGVHLTMVQLAAFNTPQFDWGLSRMPREPRPMGKVFQPEIAAEAIYWAAHHKRRELTVGFPAAQAILGQRVIPGALDRFLAATGYEGQQSDEAAAPDRPNNLFSPAAGGDRGAHGRFDSEAKSTSAQLWVNTHRTALALALLPLFALALSRRWFAR